MEEPRIGVYICECGINIVATVDVPAVVEMAATLPGVVVARQHKYTCSEPGQLMIQWEFVRNLDSVQWGILPGDGITPAEGLRGLERAWGEELTKLKRSPPAFTPSRV